MSVTPALASNCVNGRWQVPFSSIDNILLVLGILISYTELEKVSTEWLILYFGTITQTYSLVVMLHSRPVKFCATMIAGDSVHGLNSHPPHRRPIPSTFILNNAEGYVYTTCKNANFFLALVKFPSKVILYSDQTYLIWLLSSLLFVSSFRFTYFIANGRFIRPWLVKQGSFITSTLTGSTLTDKCRAQGCFCRFALVGVIIISVTTLP